MRRVRREPSRKGEELLAEVTADAKALGLTALDRLRDSESQCSYCWGGGVRAGQRGSGHARPVGAAGHGKPCRVWGGRVTRSPDTSGQMALAAGLRAD